MRRAVALFITTLSAACGADDGPGPTEGLQVVRDTVGDTVVVHTVSGSAWGAPRRLVPDLSIGVLDGRAEYVFGRIATLAVGPDGTIYVIDGQGPDLRAYGAGGTYLETLAREGQGPGELNRPDGGMAVLSDGRVVVRDPGNARLQVFQSDGSEAGSWPWRGGFSTSAPMYADRADNLYSPIMVNPDQGTWETRLVRIGPDGVAADTLVPPDTPFDPPAVEIRAESMAARYGVPYAPGEAWRMHPSGHFLHWVSAEYALTLRTDEGFVRFGRAYEPVQVQADEAERARSNIVRNVRSMVADWRWDGPDIPAVKPPFEGAWPGRDGRIWVRLSTAGVRTPNPDHDPGDPTSVPDVWREPVVFDVFEEDGTYVGRVDAPDDFALSPVPVFDGDRVWATTRDELGVVRVVRYRIEPLPHP